MDISEGVAIWIQGAITAQGYLLEVLMANNLRAHPQPLQAANDVLGAIRRLIQHEMTVPPTDDPRADHLAIQTAALKHWDELCERIKTHLELPADTGDGR